MKYLQILASALLLQWTVVNAAPARDTAVHQVQTATVIRRDVSETLHVYGKISFDDAWLQNISLAHSGQIVRLPVLAGEPVAKGQLLAEMVVDPAAAAAYRQAIAAVRFAESEMARVRSLFADQLATKSQLAAAGKALSDSQTHLRQLKEQGLGKSVRELRAPFAAVVAAVPVHAGQRVAAGTTLMQLGHPNRLKVLLGVEAQDVRRISPGSPVEIHPAMNPDTRVHASVDKVLHAVNPHTRLVDVLVRLSGKQTASFLPGMTVSADLTARIFPHALIVPRSALYPQITPQRVARQSYARRALAAMVVPLQESGTPQMAGGRLARRESFQKGHPGVAALGKGNNHCPRAAPWPDPSGRILKCDLWVKGRPHRAVMYGEHHAAYVMRVEHGRVVRVPVQLVLEKDGHALVHGDLAAGQPVVTIGVAELHNGDAVTTDQSR